MRRRVGFQAVRRRRRRRNTARGRVMDCVRARARERARGKKKVRPRGGHERQIPGDLHSARIDTRDLSYLPPNATYERRV